MNMELSATESRLRVLLEWIHQQRESRCQGILDQARQEAENLLSQAKKDARSRVKQAAKEAKRQEQQALDNAKAHLETASRQRHLQHLAQLLVDGRNQLQQALQERWQQQETRREWILSLAQQAEATLPAGELRIRHPSSWSLAEWPASPRWSAITGIADDTLTAGLLVCRGGTCLDGTLQGLMGDTARVDAQLLALMESPLSSAPPRGDLP
ncbi:MAG: hypothetical protein G8345_11875 [Magnetococcales bacterium]|nr:hypothetical protein [Magnetococcales bacterium]NGZ27570.1 hypothetical protein [Magnetococcales bacterium]